MGTLRGLFGNSGISRPTCVRRIQSLLTGSVRAVASVRTVFRAVAETPLRATSSKSQPPHLVYVCYIYCLQNLSSDHLLSGVNRRIVLAGSARQIFGTQHLALSIQRCGRKPHKLQNAGGIGNGVSGGSANGRAGGYSHPARLSCEAMICHLSSRLSHVSVQTWQTFALGWDLSLPMACSRP